MKLWICGQVNVGNEWEWQGVFDSEDKAVAACRDETYFIAEVELNKEQPHESCEFEDTRYPLA